MGAVLTFLSTLFVFSVVNGTPLLYGTLGEILTEKSGNMNLGVEGILFMGFTHHPTHSVCPFPGRNGAENVPRLTLLG